MECKGFSDLECTEEHEKMSSLALFDLDAGEGSSDGENHDAQTGQQRAGNEKRALDLGPFDEEDEIERLKTLGDEEGGEALKKKATKKRRVFNAEMLTSGAGVERIYEGFLANSSLSLEGNERSTLANLMSKYKAWAFQLYPNLAFSDLVSRCETLGTKAHVRGYMETLRERERNRYLRDTLAVPAEDIVMNHSTRAEPEDSFGAEASDSPAPWEKRHGDVERMGASNSTAQMTSLAINEEEEEADFDIDWAAIEEVETTHTAQSASVETSEDQQAVETYLGQQEGGDDGTEGFDHDEDEMEALAEMEASERNIRKESAVGEFQNVRNQQVDEEVAQIDLAESDEEGSDGHDDDSLGKEENVERSSRREGEGAKPSQTQPQL